MVLGINGSQGSGKSTLTKGLTLLMPKAFNLKVAGFSLDDVYHTRQTRSELAQQVHPLLATRGVPGTHEVSLGVSLIKQLLAAKEGDTTAIPFFNKAADDRVPESEWPKHHGPTDIVIFEGWCVAAPPQQGSELSTPINQLEQLEDSSGAWRYFVNKHLEGDYADWYALIDRLIFLQIPSFEQVLIWRGKQEDKLRTKLEKQLKPGETPPGLMTPEQLVRFISHYERLTRHTLQSLPHIADLIIKLSPDHRYETIMDAAKGRQDS
jgi:D-glycerate 3-kinase